MGVRKDTNIPEPYAYMGRCIGFHYDDVKELRGDVEFNLGTPATMAMRFSDAEFDLEPGVTINYMLTVSMFVEYSIINNEHDDSNSMDLHAMSVISGASSYTIGGGEPLPLDDAHGNHQH